ncbi:MAG: PEP/pyruvate-binding domain-containing protein [Candidatus Diapherotrites archaeon]
MPEKNIVLFAEVDKNSIPLVGGKGANLGEMTNANFPVPGGFIVTSKAYFAFLNETGLKPKIVKKIDAINVDNTEELKTATAEVRSLILKTKMGEELKNEIMLAYAKLGESRLAWLTSSELPYVAVRSSATAEDLPEASFAGQQETYLNIMGKEAVVEAVKRCWASLFTARAVYYRKKQGFSTEKVGIAVVVQKMVDSEVSGVMFTADPTGDTSKIIVEAVFGLGEAIVSGSVTPDTYLVDKGKMRLLEKKIARQEWKLVRGGKTNRKIILPEGKGRKQKLSDRQIIEVAALGKQIEEHYGAPQDIEWAIENGCVLILQSRAITTLSLKDKVEKERERREALEALDAKVLIDGLAASPGIAVGSIRIVPTVKEIERVKEGDILVTKMTNPDWVPVMKKASGIITDEGGTTCHAAIVSRELGIPCIVGAIDATKKLKDGQTVTLNGYKGFVYEGRVEIKIEKKTEEKIIHLEEIDRLEDAIKLKMQKQSKQQKQLKLKPMVCEPKPGLTGIADLIKDEREMKQKIKEAEEELKKEEREREEAEKILELEEREDEETEKAAMQAEAKKVIEEFGEKVAAEMSESEYEKESKELKELLEKISAKVKVNVALPEAAEKAAATGADGVGLLRAEHMITSSGVHPAEYLRMGRRDLLVRAVRDGIEAVLKHFEGKPVWYRTFDARTDEYRNLKGGEKEPAEENPMLGWHGIRRDLDEPELLKAQFIAIKQLLDKGYSNIGIMLPFVISEQEVRKAKAIAKEIGLEREKGKLEFGVMVETPASVWIIEELIEEGIDFISFGTNDLTQLTLGIDRNNEKIQKHFSELHPAIMRSLKRVIEKCKAAGVTTSICGQAASNPEMVTKLIRYGIDSLSANIDAVEQIKHVVLVEEKKMILDGLKGKEKT